MACEEDARTHVAASYTTHANSLFSQVSANDETASDRSHRLASPIEPPKHTQADLTVDLVETGNNNCLLVSLLVASLLTSTLTTILLSVVINSLQLNDVSISSTNKHIHGKQ